MLFRALSESRHRWSLNVEAGPDRWRDELLERPAPVFQVMLFPVALLISNGAGGMMMWGPQRTESNGLRFSHTMEAMRLWV